MSITFKRIKALLKAKEYNKFEKFMCGQTYGEDGVYDNDFLRFIKGLPVID